MSFLYPSFLWALGVLSVPIIIHLFNFRKTKQIYFSNTRFLKQVKEATTAKRKLKHYLVLAARLLFLLFLVLAFAQPIIPAKEQLNNNRNITLYIDNSLSMSAQLKDKTKGLQAATGFSRDIVELFPPDTRYKIITNDFAPFSNTYKTKTEVTDLLTEIRLSPVSRSVKEIKDRIYADDSKAQEVFWISDFQKSTVGETPRRYRDSLTRWHLVPLQYGTLANVFVDSVYLENPFAANGEKNVLHVTVRNDGNKDIDQLSLKLTINNIQAATISIRVAKGNTTDANFDLATGLTGLNKVKISFNDSPISFDNDFFIALNFKDRIRVIEIKNTNLTTPVESVFGNKKIFNYSGFPVGNFNYSLLSQADLVVINGLNTLETSLQLALRSYLNNFGTMLFIPGENPSINDYNSFLQLPVAGVMKTEQAELQRPDFNNPFFESVFEEKSTSLAMPKAGAVIDWENDRAAILRFKDDQPFLSLFQQQGKLYILASPLTSGHTDFFNNALFVPVMYRVATSGKKNETHLYYTLKQNFISLMIDSLKGEETVKLIGAGQEILPAQRKVGNRMYIDIPKFSISQGFYNVAVNSDTVSLIAFNLDKAESLMDQYSGEEAKKLFEGDGNVTLFDASSTDAFSDEIKERYLGKPLWKYALLIALFFLLAEVLLIRFFK